MFDQQIANIPGAFEGFGQVGADEYQELMKALVAQEGITDIANLAGAGALQPQSLEMSLILLTWTDSHLKFYKDIPTSKGFSTLEEYSTQDSYGQTGGFVDQMENPEEGDPDFARKFAQMKYIRTLWKVSDVLTRVRTITDAESNAVQSAMLRLLRTVETSLYFGDSAKIPQSWDGLEKTIVTDATNDHVQDLRGAAPTESILKQIAQLIHDNYGTPTKMYVSPSVQTQIDQILATDASTPLARLVQNQVQGGGVMLGHRVPGMRTSFGDYAFEPNVFLSIEAQTVPTIKDPSNPGTQIEGATSAKAPATPTFVLTLGTTVSGSLWSGTAGDSGGRVGNTSNTYDIRVVAVNQYGKSEAAVAQTSGAVAPAGSIIVTITSGGGTYAPTCYEIYSEPTPGDGNHFFQASIAKASGATTVYTDKNLDLPGTSKVFLVDLSSQGPRRTVSLSQLAPIFRQPYAKIGPFNWGNVTYLATPKWYAPLRFVMLKNIGVGKRIRNPLLDL